MLKQPVPVKAAASRTARHRSGGITLRDAAKLAGVSVITASRAPNTPQVESPEVLVRVREAVLRTCYVPNLLAGGLASNRSRLVAAHRRQCCANLRRRIRRSVIRRFSPVACSPRRMRADWRFRATWRRRDSATLPSPPTPTGAGSTPKS